MLAVTTSSKSGDFNQPEGEKKASPQNPTHIGSNIGDPLLA